MTAPDPTDLPPLPDGLSARRPTEADHARVQATLGDWWGHMGGDFGDLQRALLLPRLFFQHMTDTSVLVQAGDGRQVAFLVGFLSPARPDTAYIHFVGVDPAARGRRIGAMLYESFFAAARERGCTEVSCVTAPVNDGSQRFHERLGFSLTLKDDYDGPGVPRYVMRRAL